MRAEGRIEPESICLGCQQNESKGYRPVYTLHKVAVRRHSSSCHVNEQDQNEETKEPALGDLWLKSIFTFCHATTHLCKPFTIQEHMIQKNTMSNEVTITMCWSSTSRKQEDQKICIPQKQLKKRQRPCSNTRSVPKEINHRPITKEGQGRSATSETVCPEC